jgi:hypothetical protein
MPQVPVVVSHHQSLVAWLGRRVATALLVLSGVTALLLLRRPAVPALLTVALLLLWRVATLRAWRVLLAWWWMALVAVLATVLTGWRSAVTAVPTRCRASTHVLLLVLGVVAGVDGAEDEFDHPEIWSEVDWGVGFGHFGRFVLVIYRGC